MDITALKNIASEVGGKDQRLGALLEQMIDQGHRSSCVYVKEKKDFPAPKNGVIYLRDNTEYIINGTVNIGTDKIRYGTNSYIGGLNIIQDQILYLGTGEALNSNGDGQIVGKWFNLITPNGGAINFAQDQTYQFNFEYVGFIGCSRVGTVDGFDVAAFKSCALLGTPEYPAGDGVVFTGTPNKVFFDASPIQNLTSPDFGIKFDNGFNGDLIDIVGSYFKFDGVTGIEFDPSASVRVGRLRGCLFDGIFSSGELTGFSSKTVEWYMNDNDPIPDSRIISGWGFDDNTTSLTIPSQNTWVKIDHPVTVGIQERFSVANQAGTYIGIRQVNRRVIVTGSFEPPVNNLTYEFGLFLDGSLIERGTLTTGSKNSGVTRTFVLNRVVEFNNGQTLDIRVRNITDNSNILIPNMNTTID